MRVLPTVVFTAVAAVAVAATAMPARAVDIGASVTPGATASAGAARDTMANSASRRAGKRTLARQVEQLRSVEQRPVAVHSPALALSCVPSDPGRAGGRGTVICSVPRADSGSATRNIEDRTGPGAAVRRAKLTIRGTRGAKIASARGAGWRCEVRRGKARCTDAKIRRTHSGGAVRIRVTLSRKGRPAVGGRLRWQEQKLVGGGASRVRVDGWRRQSTDDRTRVQQSDAVGVTSHVLGGKRVALRRGARAAQRQAVLRSSVTGLDGGNAVVRVRQISGPRARLDDPGRRLTSASVLDTSLTLPRAAKSSRKLCFQTAVASAGSRGKDRTCLILTRERVRRYASGVTAVRQALKSESGRGRVRLAGAVGTNPDLQISAPGPTEVKPGQVVTLRVKTRRGNIRATRWSVASGPRSLLTRAKFRKASVKVRLPHRLPTGVAILQATATLRDGTRAAAQETLVMRRGKRACAQAFDQVSAQELPDGLCPSELQFSGYGVEQLADDIVNEDPVPPAGSDSASQTFCALFDAVAGSGPVEPTELPDGSVITLGEASARGECDAEARITFAGGRIRNGDLQFTGLSGEVTEKGLTIEGASQGARWTLPDRWRDAALEWGRDLPSAWKSDFAAAWDRPGVSLHLPGTMSLVAPLADTGAWEAMTGKMRVGSLDMLPLPDGWEWHGDAELGLEPETGLITFQQTAVGPQDDDTIELTGRMGRSGSLQILATASNLDVISNDSGSLLGDGSGEITVTRGDEGTGTTFSAALDVGLSSEAGFEVARGVALKDARLAWSEEGVGFTATATVGGDSGRFTGTLDGEYADARNWRMDLRPEDSVNLGAVRLTDLSGSLSRKSLEGDDDRASYTFSVAGKAKGNLGDGVRLDAAEAQFSNGCPSDPDVEKAYFGKSGCTPGHLRMFVSGEGAVTIRGTEKAVTIKGWYSVTTGKFHIAASGGNLDVGADTGLHLSDITVVASNDEAADFCAPQKGEEDEQGTSIGFTAKGKLLGESVRFTGQYEGGGNGGYCLVGRMPGELAAGKFASVSDVTVAYSSFDAEVNLAADDPDQEDEVVEVAAKAVSLRGKVALGEEVADTTGITGGAELVATAVTSGDKAGFTGTATFDLGDGVALVDNDEVSLSLKTAKLAIDTPERKLSIGTDTELKISGSTTPLAATLAVSGGEEPSVEFATGKTGDDALDNAFGLDGLSLRTLHLSAKAALGGTGGFAFTVAAGTESLPSTWVDKIQVDDRALVEVAAQFSSSQSPCFAFSLGKEGGSSTVLDVGGQGVLTARYAKFVYAPQPCTYTAPDGAEESIGDDHNFELAFDGTVGTTPVDIEAQVGIDDTDVTVNARVAVGAFHVGPMAVSNTMATIAVDTRAGAYTFTFQGGLELGGRTLYADDVEVSFAKDGADVQLAMKARNAGLDLGIVKGGCLEQGESPGLSFAGSISGGKLQSFDANLNCRVTVIGQDLSVRGAVEYGNGGLKLLDLKAGVRLNFGVAYVEGEVQVCRSEGTYVGISGRFKVDWLGVDKPYGWNVYGSVRACRSAGDGTVDVDFRQQPVPPRSTVDQPPYQWLAQTAGCMELDDDGRLLSGHGRPLRCADDTQYVTPPGHQTIRQNSWIGDCGTKWSGRDGVDWDVCPYQLHIKTRGAYDQEPRIERSLRRADNGIPVFETFRNYTYGSNPYGSDDERTVHVGGRGRISQLSTKGDLQTPCLRSSGKEGVVLDHCGGGDSVAEVLGSQIRLDGKCLDRWHDKLIRWHDCHSGDNQRWDVDGWQLKVQGRCLQSHGIGRELTFADCNGSESQQFNVYLFEPDAHRAFASDRYRHSIDRWPACLGVCDVVRLRSTYLPGPIADESTALWSFLLRESEAGRAQLANISHGHRQHWEPILQSNRDLSTWENGAVPGFSRDSGFSGEWGTNQIWLAGDGSLQAKYPNGELKWAADAQGLAAKPVAALLDDDCRIKLVDDMGITRLESRNFRRFGGECHLQTLQGDPLWRLQSTNADRGGQSEMFCGRGGDWGFQGPEGAWERPGWAKWCQVETDADREMNPVRHADWFTDNGR
ncbi:MAG: hypothetical protein U0R64_02455 [Candidatus Nanopelagicales bacterium]